MSNKRKFVDVALDAQLLLMNRLAELQGQGKTPEEMKEIIRRETVEKFTAQQVESINWAQIESDLNIDLANEVKESGLESLMKEYDAEQKKLNPKFDKVLDLSNKVRAKVLGQPKYTAIDGLGKRLAIDGPHRESNNVWIVNILRSFSATIARRAKIVHPAGHVNAIGFTWSGVGANKEEHKPIEKAIAALGVKFTQAQLANRLESLGVKRAGKRFKFTGKGQESWSYLVKRVYAQPTQVNAPKDLQPQPEQNATPKSGKTVAQATQIAA